MTRASRLMRSVSSVLPPLLTALLALVLVASLVGCAFGPYRRDDGRFKELLREDFPGFEVFALDYSDEGPGLSFDAARLTVYRFTLESERVSGFRISGQYYLTRYGQADGWKPRGSIFDGTSLSGKQIAAFERQWFGLFPGDVVEVGDDAVPSRRSGYSAPEDVARVAPEYRGLSPDWVFGFSSRREKDGLRQPFRVFYLDSGSSTLRYLPDYFAEGEE